MQDVTIKKLTNKNPAMAEKSSEIWVVLVCLDFLALISKVGLEVHYFAIDLSGSINRRRYYLVSHNKVESIKSRKSDLSHIYTVLVEGVLSLQLLVFFCKYKITFLRH